MKPLRGDGSMKHAEKGELLKKKRASLQDTLSLSKSRFLLETFI